MAQKNRHAKRWPTRFTCRHYRAVSAIGGSVILLLSLSLPALATSAITCHCFTDRSYDPAQPAVADPYFLATTQNSFFAELFSVDKKGVVLKKQQGTAADDLWIAYWVAQKTGGQPEQLLQAKQDKESWPAALAPLRLTAKTVGNRFATALNAKAPPAALAEAVVDELIIRYQLLGDKELAELRQAGAANQELILATALSAKLKRPARQIYLDVKNRAKTWGGLLQDAKINPKNIQRELASLLKTTPR